MPSVICANCRTLFAKRASQIKQSSAHYCSRSCAAQTNNRLHPKRHKMGVCQKCSKPVSSSHAYCAECKGSPKEAKIVSMKHCVQCEQTKPLAEFYNKSDGAQEGTLGSRQCFCKSCHNSYCISRWQRRKLEAIAYLGGCCGDCGGLFHANVYDFHHLRDKDADWNRLRLRSWDKIVQELDKCVLLCANCHRMRHVEE